MQVDFIDVGRQRPLVGLLGALRALPAIASQLVHGEIPPKAPEQMRLHDTTRSPAREGGWILLGERPNEEIALGLVGKFWRPIIEFAEVRREGFRDFDTPGYAKTIYALSVRPLEARRTLLLGRHADGDDRRDCSHLVPALLDVGGGVRRPCPGEWRPGRHARDGGGSDVSGTRAARGRRARAEQTGPARPGASASQRRQHDAAAPRRSRSRRSRRGGRGRGGSPRRRPPGTCACSPSASAIGTLAALGESPAGCRARRASAPRSCPTRAGRPAAGCSRCWRGARPSAPPSSRGAACCSAPDGAAAAPARAARGVCSSTSSSRSRRAALLVARRRAGRAGARDRRPAAAAAAMRNGASASGVTTHGEIVVAKFFARNGPSGWYSQAWMSRADQSFSRQKPAMWSAASAIGDRRAQGDCPGRSRRRARARSRGVAARAERRARRRSAGLRWPLGRRTVVPDTPIDELRP